METGSLTNHIRFGGCIFMTYDVPHASSTLGNGYISTTWQLPSQFSKNKTYSSLGGNSGVNYDVIRIKVIVSLRFKLANFNCIAIHNRIQIATLCSLCSTGPTGDQSTAMHRRYESNRIQWHILNPLYNDIIKSSDCQYIIKSSEYRNHHMWMIAFKPTLQSMFIFRVRVGGSVLFSVYSQGWWMLCCSVFIARVSVGWWCVVQCLQYVSGLVDAVLFSVYSQCQCWWLLCCSVFIARVSVGGCCVVQCLESVSVFCGSVLFSVYSQCWWMLCCSVF